MEGVDENAAWTVGWSMGWSKTKIREVFLETSCVSAIGVMETMGATRLDVVKRSALFTPVLLPDKSDAVLARRIVIPVLPGQGASWGGIRVREIPSGDQLIVYAGFPGLKESACSTEVRFIGALNLRRIGELTETWVDPDAGSMASNAGVLKSPV